MAHKFHAVRTTVDGIAFASKAEARRYAELRLLEKAGQIDDLERQPKFALHVASTLGQAHTLVGHYFGDFRYRDARRGRIVEDVKGVDTPLSHWKRKHVALQYGITVELITRRI